MRIEVTLAVTSGLIVARVGDRGGNGSGEQTQKHHNNQPENVMTLVIASKNFP